MPLRIRRMRNGDLATDGLPTRGNQAFFHARRGDVRQIKIDLTDALPSAVTISTVTTSGQLSVGTPTIASGVITFNATAPSGSQYADITANLSNGEKITQRLHALESTPEMTKDYDA